MLKSKPALALVPGDVTDLSKRTFNGITGFQYAVWALDWHMWTMIRKYLLPQEAQLQAQGFETCAWVRQHGVHANLNTLIQAYQTTIDLCNARNYNYNECNIALGQVRGAQRLLPAHVINEYYHPTRPFYPLPNFKDAASLPRARIYDWRRSATVARGGGDVQTIYHVPLHCDWHKSCMMVSYFHHCGGHEGCSYVSYCHCLPDSADWHGFKSRCEYDHKAVQDLTSTRTAQREELIAELMPKNVQRNAA
jgi:hypothetical protein